MSPTECKSRVCLFSVETLRVETSWWFVVAPGRRWRVPVLTVGMINVVCWSPNTFITLRRYMYCQYDESVHRKEQLATIINTIQYKMLNLFTFAFAK